VLPLLVQALLQRLQGQGKGAGEEATGVRGAGPWRGAGAACAPTFPPTGLLILQERELRELSCMSLHCAPMRALRRLRRAPRRCSGVDGLQGGGRTHHSFVSGEGSSLHSYTHSQGGPHAQYTLPT